MKIAIAGKGGSGKSTITALLSKVFSSMGFRVTVVDADESNVGLSRMLGLTSFGKQVMDLYGGRRGFKEALNRGLEISPNIDLVSIIDGNIRLVKVGKIDRGGEGCACLIGILAKEVLSKLHARDEIVLVDMDAGIEHFGRGVDKAVDAVLFVVDPTHDSVMLAEKASKMAADLGVSKFLVVLNKVDEGSERILTANLLRVGIRVIGVVRYDPEVARSMLIGEALRATTAENDVINLANAILKELGGADNGSG
ncbi:MAG: P-loop NTPase [Candidatus Nezhaarchaeota archaeon]|nr:P-loop NTPase [Candidatus Nezhaarchaeota archaeon]MCX8142282.1 P-loop NTPase [Candidatus Nezhaarchaeota archaeon]MDW8050745.1 P-loop NTPase [Nitrososphaerota archaeon]